MQISFKFWSSAAPTWHLVFGAKGLFALTLPSFLA
jgi:hypothetical protein